MTFTRSQIERNETEGFLQLGQILAAEEIASLRAEILRLGSPERELKEANLVNDEGVI